MALGSLQILNIQILSLVRSYVRKTEIVLGSFPADDSFAGYATFKTYDLEKQKKLAAHARNLRLMVSGSSALPEPIFTGWEEVTGHRLLERYSMTEILMAISNPLSPTSDRIPRTIGKPFPGVELKLNPIEKESTEQDSNDSNVELGELLIKSPAMFSSYYGLPKATAESF